MVKISIIGIGRIGSALAYSLVSNPKIDELLLLDIIQSKVDSAILDISHAYPEFAHKLKTGSYENTVGSEIIVISAGLSRTPEMRTRMDLLDANKKTIQSIVKSIDISNNTILIILTNPVELLTYLAYKLSGLPSKNVIGFGNMLDSERLRFILSQRTGVGGDKIDSLVIGEHGENMIPVFSQCRIDNKPLTNFNFNFSEIAHELVTASKNIIKSVGGTQFGPVKNLEKLINAILNNTNEIFPVSSFIENNEFYGVSDVCISLPTRIGKNGIDDVIKLNLNDDEKLQLKNLALRLKEMQNNIGVCYEGSCDWWRGFYGIVAC